MKGWGAFLRLVACLAVCQAAGLAGAVATTPAIPTWYASLAKPAFNPPDWVFAPVWTALYLLMGVSAFLVWRAGAELARVKTQALAFAAQLALNVLWSFAFFGLRSPAAGLVVIALLLAAIVWMIAAFHRASRLAACLQIPYALWVGFASVLNASLFFLNR